MTRDAHLRILPHDVVEDGLVCGLAEAARYSSLLVVLVPRAQSFRAKVEGVAEGLVDALQCISLRHENLAWDNFSF